MYRRLWWKDARQFWPIWAFLLLAAGVTQLLVHHFASPETRGTVLLPLAIGWPFLYAFAVGAAAFAGERETGTLLLLDVLPAPRRVVWAGKVSFAIVSTIALALLLLVLAVLDTPPGLAGVEDGRSRPAQMLGCPCCSRRWRGACSARRSSPAPCSRRWRRSC